MPEEEITKSIFGFTPLKLQKEITKLQEQVEKQEEKLSNPKLVPSQGKQIRDKIKIMKDSIETKTEALAVKNVKHSEEWRTVTTEDKDFFSSVQEQLENQKSVPDGLIENINTNLKKKVLHKKSKVMLKNLPHCYLHLCQFLENLSLQKNLAIYSKVWKLQRN